MEFGILLSTAGVFIQINYHRGKEKGDKFDSDHATIEKKKKLSGTDVYHPHDWYQLVNSCKTGKNPFAVERMTRKNFYDFNSLFANVFRKCKTNIEKKEVRWSTMRIVRYSKDTFGESQNKKFYDSATKSNFEIVDMKKVRTRHSKENLENILLNLPNVHIKHIPISHEKKKDLLSLLQYIPEVFHEFYKNINSDKSTNDFLYDTDED